MKFKSIFWLFNAVVIIALTFFILISLILFGPDYAMTYWANMWIVAAVFVILIVTLDTYFILNWPLFDFLEKEDWPALLAWLEKQIYGKDKLRRIYANLLINTALSVSNFDAVNKLEVEIRQRKPKMLKNLGVSLGIPTYLEKNAKATIEYFGPLADDEKTFRRDWAQWCRAEASGSNGLEEMINLLATKDAAIRLLALEHLNRMREELNSDQLNALEEASTDLQKLLAGDGGKRILQRSRDDHLLCMVLSSRIEEASKSLLGNKKIVLPRL